MFVLAMDCLYAMQVLQKQDLQVIWLLVVWREKDAWFPFIRISV